MTMISPEVVIVCQLGIPITDQVRYGALRATIEMAKHLKALGRDVLLVGMGIRGDGQVEGVGYVALGSEWELKRFIRSLKKVRYLIGISRGDVLLMTHADHYLVYHHGPHPPQGIDVPTLRLAHVPIVCVSESSKKQQIDFGFDPADVHVVRNGYDKMIFYPEERGIRDKRSLFFAGSIISYKGVDIALNAYRRLRDKFSDATFHLCGRQHLWSSEEVMALPPKWSSAKGYLNWITIEDELPGVKYHGELSQFEVARLLNSCSLLVMSSRVAEPCPLIVIEAQACGCIPVVPNTGGWPEILDNGISGYLYDAPADPEGLFRKIDAIWSGDGPSSVQRAVACNYAHRFTWDGAGNQFNAILQSLKPYSRRRRFLCSLFSVWQSVRHRVRERVLKYWWAIMKWTKPLRHGFQHQKKIE